MEWLFFLTLCKRLSVHDQRMWPPGMFSWSKNFCGTALTSVKPKDWTSCCVWRGAFRWSRTNTGTSRPSAIPMAYSVLGLGWNKVKRSSRLVCQFPLAVPDIPQLQPQPATGAPLIKRGYITSTEFRVEKFKHICTQNPHCPVQSLLLCTSCFCERFFSLCSKVSVLDHLISI